MGRNQLAYHLVREGEALLDSRNDVDLIAFFQNLGQPWRMIVPFASMNIAEAFTFDGVAIATSLDTAERVGHFPGPRLRYFYAWDLEWLRATGRTFEQHSNVYSNRNLPILARSDEHARLIERCWNRPVRAVIENCDLSALLKVIAQDDKG